MGKRTDPKTFFEKMRPYAEKVKAVLGIPVSITLAQWAYESDFEGPKWTGNRTGKYNYSGIRKDNKSFRSYSSIDKFVDDHIRILSLKDNPNSDWKRGYEAIVDASKSGRSIPEIADAFAKSRWNMSNHYIVNGKNILVDRINEYNLTRFDGGDQTSSNQQNISYTHPDGQTTQYAIDHGNKPSTINDGDNDISITEFLGKLSYVFSKEFWEKSGLFIIGIVLVVIGFKFVLTAK